MKELIERKAKLYLKEELLVHIETIDGRFYNGLITLVHSDHLVLCDRKIGILPIFFDEIKVFDKFLDKEKA